MSSINETWTNTISMDQWILDEKRVIRLKFYARESANRKYNWSCLFSSSSYKRIRTIIIWINKITEIAIERKNLDLFGSYLGWRYPPALKSARDNESLAYSCKRIHALRPTINCIILDPGHSMHPTATSKGRIRSRETIDNEITSNASLRV